MLYLKHQLSQKANIYVVHHELLFESVVVPLSAFSRRTVLQLVKNALLQV